MTTPNYLHATTPEDSVDLTDITLAETATGYAAINYSGGGGGAPAAGIDLAMQGTNCIDRPVSNAERAIAYDNVSPPSGITTSGVHIYQWLFVATPGLCDNLATRGAYIVVGTGLAATVQFHVEGNETYGAAPRVGRCYPIRYVNTANTGSIPYRTLDGSPGATPDHFGAGLKTTATAKGSNLGVDACRYGTGAYITDGVAVTDPASFQGFAAFNDEVDNRYGILTDIGGSLELQGRFVIGQNNSAVATICAFEDADVNIIIVDTVHSDTDFSQIIIDHASTTCDWVNVSISALGTNNKGSVIVNSANPVFDVSGGTWTAIDATVLRANSTIIGLTWRATGTITLNGATITDCLIENNIATSALITNPVDMTNVTGTTFISDGSGHAIDLGTVDVGSSDVTMAWDNSESGYGSAQTSDATILVNVINGGTNQLIVNVAAGASTPTVNNTGTGGAADVDVVAGLLTVSITVTDDIGAAIENARVEIRAAETIGTITTGDIILTGLTNSSGLIELTTFAYEPAFDPSGLDITIKARQGSVPPFKVPSDSTGTIVDVAGFTTIIALQPDE